MKQKYLFIGLSVMLLLLVTGCSSTSTTQTELSQPFVYTGDEGGSISKINTATNTVVNTIKVDGSIHNVQVSSNGRTLGATLVEEKEEHSSSSMEMNGFALFYDTLTDKLLKRVEVGKHPAHIVFTSDDRYALVTNDESNDVSVIDMKNYAVVARIPTGNGPHGFRISQDNKLAYVANMNEDTVSVLNLSNFTEEKRIKVGKTPVTTAVSNDGKTLLVTINSENVVGVVDLATDKVTKIPVGNGPAQVFIEPDNRYAFVANQGTKAKPSNSLTKIDLINRKVVATIPTGDGAHGIATSDDNKLVYVTNMFDNTVSVLDNSTDTVIATIRVGEVPNGISYKK